MADIASYAMNNALFNKATDMLPSPRMAAGNMFIGGQLGVGARTTTMDAATALVFNPAICVVIQTPTMWDTQPDRQQMLKALVETHTHSITGTDFGYTTETASQLVGHDGQELKTPTRTARGAVSPSMIFNEVPGNLVANFFRSWQFDMQHPDTNASVLAATHGGSDNIPAWVMSAYSMSMVMILPDPTLIPDRMIDCALYTGMFPTETGELGFQRVINQSEIKERTIGFTGIVQHNSNTWELGYQILTLLQLHRINYNFALPGLSGVAAASGAIQTALQDSGINLQASTSDPTGVAATFIPASGADSPVSVSDFTGITGMMTTSAPINQGSGDPSYSGTNGTTTSDTIGVQNSSATTGTGTISA